MSDDEPEGAIALPVDLDEVRRARKNELDRARKNELDRARDARRRAHREGVEAKRTEGVREQASRVRLRVVDDDPVPARPRTRGDCVDAPRPCPWVGCRYHLAIDVTPTGSITHNFPNLDLDQLEETCALDVAEQGGVTEERVARLTNRTRQGIQLFEKKLVAHLARIARWYGLDPEALAAFLVMHRRDD